MVLSVKDGEHIKSKMSKVQAVFFFFCFFFTVKNSLEAQEEEPANQD